eukprot:gene4276-7612_t
MTSPKLQFLPDTKEEEDEVENYDEIDSPKLSAFSPKTKPKSYSLIDQTRTESIPDFSNPNLSPINSKREDMSIPKINLEKKEKKSRRFSLFGAKKEETPEIIGNTKSPRFSIFSPKKNVIKSPEVSPRFNKHQPSPISPRFSLKNLFSPRATKNLPKTPRGYDETASFSISNSKLPQSGLSMLESHIKSGGNFNAPSDGFSSFLDIPLGPQELGEDFDSLNSNDKFLRIKEYRLETFETIQDKNLSEMNILEEEHTSEGCLYSEGLEFYFWVKAGGHLVQLFREKKKGEIDITYQIFEEHNRETPIWETTSKLEETFEPDVKFIEAIGRSIETLFLLKISVKIAVDMTQELLLFGQTLDVKKEKENEQRIQINIKQTHEVAFSQWISLWNADEEIKISHLMSDLGPGVFYVKIKKLFFDDRHPWKAQLDIENTTTHSIESCVSSTTFPPFILYPDQTDSDRYSKVKIKIQKEKDEDGLYMRLKTTVKKYNYEIQILRVLGREEVTNRSHTETNEFRVYLQKQIRIAYNQEDMNLIDSILLECGSTKSSDEYIQKSMNFVYDDAKKYKTKLKEQLKYREDISKSMRERNKKELLSIINLTSDFPPLFHIRVRAQKICSEIDEELQLKSKMLSLLENQCEELTTSQELNSTYISGLQVQRKNLLAQAQKYKYFKSTAYLLLKLWVESIENQENSEILNGNYHHLLLISKLVTSIDMEKSLNSFSETGDIGTKDHIEKLNLKIEESVKRLDDIPKEFLDIEYDDIDWLKDASEELIIYHSAISQIGHDLRKLLYKFKVNKTVDTWMNSSNANLVPDDPIDDEEEEEENDEHLKSDKDIEKSSMLPTISFFDKKMKALDISKMSEDEINEELRDVYDEMLDYYTDKLEENDQNTDFEVETSQGKVGDLYRKKLLPIIEWIFNFGLINPRKAWDYIRDVTRDNDFYLSAKSIDNQVNPTDLNIQTEENIKLVKFRCFISHILSDEKKIEFLDLIFGDISTNVNEEYYDDNSMLNKKSKNKFRSKIVRNLTKISNNPTIKMKLDYSTKRNEYDIKYYF